MKTRSDVQGKRRCRFAGATTEPRVRCCRFEMTDPKYGVGH